MSKAILIFSLIVSFACMQIKASNSEAKAGIDLNAESIASESIDSVRVLKENGAINALIVLDQIKNLDTYAFRLIYDKSKLSLNGSPEKSFMTVLPGLASATNILETKGGVTCCFGYDKKTSTEFDTLYIYHTLVGQDSAHAPDGFGLLGTLNFSTNLTALDSTEIILEKVEVIDYQSNFVSLTKISHGKIKLIPEYKVSIASSDESMGDVDPKGISIVTHKGSLVAKALPAKGYDFVQWEVTGSLNPSSLTTPNIKLNGVQSDGSLLAKFQIKTYELSIAASSNGTVDKPNVMTTRVNHGDSVLLEATADYGFELDQWQIISGSGIIRDAKSTSTYIILEEGDATVQAIFKPIYFALKTTSIGSGKIIITSGGAPVADLKLIQQGTPISLEAIPEPGWFFQKWISVPIHEEVDSVQSLKMLANYSVTAQFVQSGSLTISGLEQVDANPVAIRLWSDAPGLGKIVLTDNGSIDNLRPGIAQVLVQQSGKQTENHSVLIPENTNAKLNVSLRDKILRMIDSSIELKSKMGAIENK